jgi:hypothetical protein
MRTIFILLIVCLLTACGAAEPVQTHTPPPGTPTITPPPTEANLPPTLTPTDPPPTTTPVPATARPTATERPATCLYETAHEVDFAPETFTWEAISGNARLLRGLAHAPLKLAASGNQLAMTADVGMRENQPMPDMTTALIDLVWDEHRILGEDLPGYYEDYYAWLPNGQLVWLGDGGENLYLNGERLNVPEPLRSIEAVTARAVLAQPVQNNPAGPNLLLSLDDFIWREVPALNEVDIVGPGGDGYVFHGFARSASGVGIQFYTVTDFEGTPRPLGTFVYRPLGTSSVYLGESRMAQGGRIALYDRRVTTEDPFYVQFGVLVDVMTGEQVTPPESDAYVTLSSLSPDGTWLAVGVADEIERPERFFSARSEAIYLAPTADPSAGTLYEGTSLVGWVEGNIAVLREGDALTIRIPNDNAPPRTITVPAEAEVQTAGNAIIVQPAPDEARFVWYAPNSTRRGDLTLPQPFDTLRQLTMEDGRVIGMAYKTEPNEEYNCASQAAIFVWEEAGP